MGFKCILLVLVLPAVVILTGAGCGFSGQIYRVDPGMINNR
jgi:hypothetical protein